MIGLGSYAFFWQRSADDPGRPDIAEQLRRTRALGVDLFQICDDPELDAMTDSDIGDLRALADDLGIALELGTRGIAPAHLARYLDLATGLGARLVRSMLTGPDSRPTPGEAEGWLAASLPAFADAGVRLALETYEQIRTRDLVDLVESVGHPSLGICLDPANAVANLEHPKDVVETAAPHVLDLHVKDFRFTRRDGWVGFTLEGAPLGTGLLDLDHLLATIRPAERGIACIVEHWLPFGTSLAEAQRTERDWTTRTLTELRSRTT